MAFITELRERVDALAAMGCLEVDAAELPASLAGVSDADIQRVLVSTAALSNQLQRLSVVVAGVVAQRSTRERGHTGLAATQGHRSATDLVQSITGGTRADAGRQVRLGTSIMDAATDAAAAGDGELVPAPRAWDEGLRRAMLAGELTAAQHDAIVRGLGASPVVADPASGGVHHRPDEAVVAAWALAGEHLMNEAAECSPEDLLHRARAVRDALDPVGAEGRARGRFDARSFRKWTDAGGTRRASISFDDESSAWVDTVLDAALRPRRGGPPSPHKRAPP